MLRGLQASQSLEVPGTPQSPSGDPQNLQPTTKAFLIDPEIKYFYGDYYSMESVLSKGSTASTHPPGRAPDHVRMYTY